MAEIRFLTDMDALNWDEYVRSHSEGTLFHLLAWKKVVERTFGHGSRYLVAVTDNRDRQQDKWITGILPLFRIKSMLFGHSLVSVPFAELGGVLADYEEVANELLQSAAQITRDIGAEYAELKHEVAHGDLPVKHLYYNFQREILEDPNENLQAIPRKSRRMVRVGMKSGLYAEFGSHLLHEFYELLAKNYHSLGTPIFPRSLFANFLDFFQDQAEIMLVREPRENKAISGVFSFFYQDRVMPYYAGSLTEYRHLAPNDFMYWKLMDYGRERGYKWFDFGRSKEGTGSYRFKKHWGFEPKQLAYQYILNTAEDLPDKSPNNPKYQRKIALWRKMPLWMTKVAGPRIAKYLC